MLAASNLEKHKVVRQNPLRINCRCPYCGDSQKSRSKARGWFTERGDMVFYSCFNCGIPTKPLHLYLKEQDSALYNEFVTESYIGKARTSTSPNEKFLPALKEKQPEQKKPVDSGKVKLYNVTSLVPDHKARVYLRSRLIPEDQISRLYYSPKFKQWVNSIIPDKLPIYKNMDEERLIMPFLSREKKMFGFAARALGESSLRYISIMFNEDKPKVFGLDRVDFTKRYYVTEGAIDSLFLPNAIAMGGADIPFGALEHPENAVFVHDNEPRNKEICDRMERLIDMKMQVCLWPKSIKTKDINDMVMSGMTKESVLDVIEDNVVSGMSGKLSMMEWKRV